MHKFGKYFSVKSMSFLALAFVGFLFVLGSPDKAAAASILSPGNYVPSPTDIYVPSDSATCCISNNPTNGFATYAYQAFVATGARPSSLTIGLFNNLTDNVPAAPISFHLLITTDGIDKPGSILWESGDLSVPELDTKEHDVTVQLNGITFTPGDTYGWVLDLNTPAGTPTFYAGVMGDSGNSVPRYNGANSQYWAHLKVPTGNGRDADFASPWIGFSSFNESFLMTFSAVPEPATWAMLIFGFGAIGCMLRRQRENISIVA